MVDYVVIPDSNLEPDKPVRTVDGLALRDNPIHMNENEIGCVKWFAANTPPPRTLECDGSAVSRTTYALLFAVIGTTFGVGDGSTTFNLPDLRGEFIRGWDHGRGVDSGRSFASAQGGAIQSHTHDYTAPLVTPEDEGVGTGADGVNGGTATVTGATGGGETRPRNIALMPVIVYRGDPP